MRMKASIPEVLDAWRMVAARCGFEGSLPLASMTRLHDSLADTEGEVRVAIEFDRDVLQVPYIELRIDAELPLQCQRSLQRFLHPVSLVQRLGLIRAGDAKAGNGRDEEAEEEALPEGYEPLLLPEDGMLRPAELVEDELILAVPVVPVAPGTEAVQRDWQAGADEEMASHPFAGLAALKAGSSQE